MARRETNRARTTTRQNGQLSIQVDICADRVADLIAANRKKTNEAMAQGDLAKADELDDTSIRLTVYYATLIRHELQKIDDSDEMREVIKGFAEINARIEKTIADIQSVTAFTKAVTGIAQVLDKLIAMGLVAV